MTIAPDASFRIQYDSESGDLYFSYLPEGEELVIDPLEEDFPENDVVDAGRDDEANVGDDDEHMDVEDEDEEIRQTKRPKLR